MRLDMKSIHHRILITLIFVLLALTACQGGSEIGKEEEIEGGSYRVVTVQELQSKLETKDFLMVNVHIPWEGDIPQTDLRLPYDQIEQSLEQLPEDRDAKILVYCLTSGMAKKAVATLVSQGYTDVWMLDGGATAWSEAQLPLNSKP